MRYLQDQKGPSLSFAEGVSYTGLGGRGEVLHLNGEHRDAALFPLLLIRGKRGVLAARAFRLSILNARIIEVGRSGWLGFP